VVPLGDALRFLPERAIDAEDAERVAHGIAVAGTAEDGDAVRLTHDGRLLAIARAGDGGLLKPYVVLAP
jgi:hypothetical protein